MLKKEQQFKKGEIVIYRSKSGPQLDVRLENETVWLTQRQMAELFDKDTRTINEHVGNIYGENELKKGSTIRKFRIVQDESGRKVVRNVDLYNLDVIISVGYRVKSLRGTQFRIWATKRLKEHLVKGYTVNEHRLLKASERFRELQETIELLKNKSGYELLAGQEKELFTLLADYSKTLTVNV